MRTSGIAAWRRGVATTIVMAVLVGGPVAGYDELVARGETGDVLARTGDGVICQFLDRAGTRRDNLRGIQVMPIRVRGPRQDSTVVGYRFIVKQLGPGFSESSVIFRSPVLRGVASKNTAAAFPARYWANPQPDVRGKSSYDVHVVFYFYEPGTWGQKAGKTRGRIERFRWQHPGLGNVGTRPYCGRNVYRDPGDT